MSLENMRRHALLNNITKILVPKTRCGLDKLQWVDVFKLIQDNFTCSGIQNQIITKRQTDSIRGNPSSNNEHYVEKEVEKYTNDWTKERDEPGTDFTGDSKSCQPSCTEHFPILRSKQLNDDLIDYYLQYQSEDIKNLIKEFDFRYTDIEDEELITLILYEHGFQKRIFPTQVPHGPGKTETSCHLETKLRTQKTASNKCPPHLKDKPENLFGQLQDSGIIREMGDDDELGSLFVNPIKLLPKADYVKLFIDARYLNSINNLTNFSWPLEPVQIIMTRINGKYFTASDLSCADHQVSLSPETQKMTSFVIGRKLDTY